MSKYMAGKMTIPKFGDRDDSDSYEEVEVEEGSSSGSSAEMNIMPPIEESELEGSFSEASGEEDFTDMTQKEDPKKRASLTVFSGTFDDEEDKPPAKKAARVVTPAAKDKIPSQAKSYPAATKTGDKVGNSTPAQKQTADMKAKSAAVEKNPDAKKVKSAAAKKETDDKKVKNASAEKKADGTKVNSATIEKKTDAKEVKSAVAVKKSSPAEKKADGKKRKKSDDKKGKSALAQKETDDQTSDVKISPPALVPSSETLSTKKTASAKRPLFGSWNQNVEEEVLFVTRDPDEPNEPARRTGLFGSLRRQKSHDSIDEENPGGAASTDGSIKEKKGMFGSFRSRKSRDSLDEEVPAEAEKKLDEVENSTTPPTDESATEKKEMFGSLRRRKSRDSLDEEKTDVPGETEENLDIATDSETSPKIEGVKEKKGMFGSLRRGKDNPALAINSKEPTREKGDMFGGSLGEMPMHESAPGENDLMQEEKPKLFLPSIRRSKAANEDKAVRALAVPVGGAPDDEGRPLTNIPYSDQGKPVTCRKLGAALLLAVIVLVGTNIGTSYLGAKLVLENFGEKPVVNINANVNSTITVENVAGPCSFEDVYLEFKIRFDSNPGHTGAILRDKGPIGAKLWNFGNGAFSSFSQFQRENTFSVCLSPSLPYEFELTDLGGDGLVGSFIDSVIYGDWQLKFNDELVARYHGDCNQPGLTACGDFCSCKYSLLAGGSVGGCTTNCTDNV